MEDLYARYNSDKFSTQLGVLTVNITREPHDSYSINFDKYFKATCTSTDKLGDCVCSALPPDNCHNAPQCKNVKTGSGSQLHSQCKMKAEANWFNLP